ncbi:MAG: hypothetical protein HZB91_08995 [Elusimicrobia bacterium]|nr:hypothetical protein [Elusimicrobiota bacterium]
MRNPPSACAPTVVSAILASLLSLAAGPAATAGSLEADAAAFKTRLAAETAGPNYNEHLSLDLDKDLATLEARAKGDPSLLADLMTLRAKVVPDFYRPNATKNPELFKEMRWSEFVALRNADMDRTHPLLFSAEKAAWATGTDSPDFVSTDPGADGRRLTTAEIVALWRKFQAASQSAPEALGADMSAMKALLDRIGRRIGSKDAEDRRTAAKDLALLFENMNQADVGAMSRKDPEMLRDLLAGMSKLRDNADPGMQKWLHQEGSVERFDQKLFELTTDPNLSQVHALMRGLKPPPGLQPKGQAGTDPDAPQPSWWDGFTAAGAARLQRDAMLKEQVDLSLRLLWQGDSGSTQGFSDLPPAVQELIEGGDRLADPLSREAWLVEVRRQLDGSKNAKELDSLVKAVAAKGALFAEMSPEEAAEDPAVKALAEFRDKHRQFMETYSMMKGMSAQYTIWLRDNLAALPDGARVDSRTLGIHPDTLPRFNPEERSLVKRTRDIGGAPHVGLEYTANWNYKDGRGTVKMTKFWTSETGPGGVTVPVTYTLDPQGAIKQRDIYLEKEEGGYAAVTEEGEFDETGRLAKGKVTTAGRNTFELVDSEDEEVDLGNGRIRRTRRMYDKADQDQEGKIRTRQRIVELLDKADRRLLARRTSQIDPASGKEQLRATVHFDDKGETAALETAALGPDGKVLRSDEWFVGRLKPSGWIYDPETGESYSARDPEHARHIERVVAKLQEYAPHWVHRVTDRKTSIQKTLLVGEVQWEAADAEDPGKGSGPVLIGPGLYELQTDIDKPERPITFQIELGPLKGLPRQVRLETLKGFVEQMRRAYARYQPEVIAIGFWGADDVGGNPDALVAFLDEAVDQAALQGLDPVVVLNAQDQGKAPYLVTFVDKDRKPVHRYYASYREFSGYGSNPWGSGRVNKGKSVPHGLTVFGMRADGSRGSMPLRHIVSPTEVYLPKWRVSVDNYIFGTDWGPTLNNLLGARQFERQDFVQFLSDENGKFKREGDLIVGDWKQTHDGPTVFKVVWDSVDKAGETIVAFGGVAIGAVMYAAAEADDFMATGMEDAIGTALEQNADPGVARRYKQQLEEQRAFRVAFKENLKESVVANAAMNPLVASWRRLGMSEEDIALEMKKHGQSYVFEAPNVMARQAVASDSWAEKMLWGGASAFTNLGLQTGKGLAVYGPLGNIGAPRAWVVNGVPKVGPVWSATAGGVPRVVMGQLTAPQSALTGIWNTGFQTTMGALGIHGAAETTLGQGGIVDAAVNLFGKGGPDAELAFYQSLNNFTAATVPYFAGIMASRRKGGAPNLNEKPGVQPHELVTRAALAERVLKTGVNEAQVKALNQAHEVGLGEPGKNGQPASVGNYTTNHILRKARILKQAGFTPEQIRALMEADVVGVPPAETASTQPGRHDILDNPGLVKVRRDSTGKIIKVEVSETAVTQAFEIAKRTRDNQRVAAEGILRRTGIAKGEVSSVTKGQHPDGLIEPQLRDFKAGVDEKFTRKNGEGKNYDTLNKMTDMSRGRISVDSFGEVQRVVIEMLKPENAGALRVKSITYPRDTPPQLVAQMKAACPGCDIQPNTKQPNYPRIHLDVLDPATGMVHEWQVGTKAYNELQQVHNIDISRLPPEIQGRLASLDPFGVKDGKAYFHLLEYDLFALNIEKKHPQIAKRFGVDRFLEEFNNSARATNGWTTDASGKPLRNTKSTPELGKWAQDILQDLAKEQPGLFDHLGHD